MKLGTRDFTESELIGLYTDVGPIIEGHIMSERLFMPRMKDQSQEADLVRLTVLAEMRAWALEMTVKEVLKFSPDQVAEVQKWARAKVKETFNKTMETGKQQLCTCDVCQAYEKELAEKHFPPEKKTEVIEIIPADRPE